MSMTGPYQPVVIRVLLEKGGQAKLEDIAEFLAGNDPQAIDDYTAKLKIYPKQVLKKHGIAEIK